MNIVDRLLVWANDIHLAREEVKRLHKERGAFQCAYEEPIGKERHPCWKWVTDDGVSDRWDNHRGLDTCESCEKRDRVNAKYHAAVRRLGALKGALWKFAAKAHQEFNDI